MSSSLVRIEQDRVVELARHRQRPPGGAGGFDAGDVGGLRRRRRLDGERGAAACAVDLHGHVLVAQRVGARSCARCGGSATPLALAGRSLPLGELARALLHRGAELRRLRDLVDQPPLHRALAAHAFGRGAEDVGQVVAHVALVGHARQAAGAGQHAEQRHLGQRDRRRAVVDQHDLVAGQRQLVAAAGARAVHRGEELQPRVLASCLRGRCASRW